MRRLSAVLLLLALLAVPVPARALRGTPFASELITVSTVAIGITADLCTLGTTVNPATIEVVTNAVNYSEHLASVTPDTTYHLLRTGDVKDVDAGAVPLLRMVRNGGVDATVRVTCKRQ